MKHENDDGTLDVAEVEIMSQLKDLVSQADLETKGDNLSAFVLELGAGLLSGCPVYGCMLRNLKSSLIAIVPRSICATYRRLAERYRGNTLT